MVVGSLLAGAAGGATISIVIQAVDKFSGVFALANKKLLATGVAITALGVAGLAVSKSLINTAASFETAFTGVRKTVELTEAEFANLRQGFKDLSKETPVTFQQLSAIGEIAGQLGVEGVDNIESFTKVIADLSSTTNLTAENAATSFARIANIMQEPIESADRMGSAVVDLGNNFATTETEIVNFAQRIAGAGNIAGLSTQNILAIGTAMSSVGVQAEAGGTAVQKVLIDINKSVVESGEELEIYAKTAGLTTEEFARAWEQDAGKAFARFVEGLGSQGDQAINTLSDLGLEDQRLIRSFLSLANAGDLLTNTIETSDLAWIENTALVAEAEKRYGTTDSQVAILQNKFASLKDDMGRALIPAFLKLIDVLGGVMGWLEQHPTLTKFAVAALAIGSAVALIAGPVLILIALLPAVAAGWGLVTATAGTAAVALWAAIAPIVAVVAPIAAAVAAVWLLVEAYEALTGSREADARKLREAQTAANKQFEKDPNTIFLNLQPNKSGSSDTINLNGPNKNPNVIALNDFILRPNGDIIKPSPQDTIIGTKGGLGNSIVINIDKIQGTDPDDMMEAFQKELNRMVRL